MPTDTEATRVARAEEASGSLRASSARPAPRRRPAWLEWVQAGVLLGICVTAFLWKPITSDGYYAPGDLSQSTPLLRTTPAGARVSNPLLGDVSSEIIPWQEFNASQIRSGNLPLWNPYNGSGAPHLGNGQAAPFSLYNAPFYVLSLRLALVVSVAMVLFTSGLLTYGLARHLGIGHLGGLVAAIGFSFAGVNLVWLHWTVTAAASFLPGIAWMACVLIDTGFNRRGLLAATGLAAMVALSLFAGHPETTFYSLAAAGLLCLYRLFSSRRTLKEAGIRVAAAAAAVGLGVAVAAIQVLPTLEYVANRAPSGNRQAFVDTKVAGLFAVPFLDGSPFGSHRSQVVSIGIAYIKGVELYLSAVLVMLALVGLTLLIRRRRRALLLAGLGLIWVLFVFDIGGFGRLVAKLPVLQLAIALRSIPVAALAVSILAGVGTDATRRLSMGSAARRRVLVDVAAASVVVAALGVAFRAQIASAATGSIASVGRQHVIYLAAWFLVALVAIVVPLVCVPRLPSSGSARRAVRLGSAAVLVIALFASSAFLWRDWNPTVPPGDFYARSTALNSIQRIVGDEQSLGLDAAEIPPDMNLMYRVRSPENYDAIGVKDYNALYERLMHPPALVFDGSDIGILAGAVTPTGIGNLRVFGIRYVTTGTAYPFAPGALIGRSTSSEAGAARTSFRPALLGPRQINEIVAESPSIPAGARCRLTVNRNGDTVGSTVNEPCGRGGHAFALADPVTTSPAVEVTLVVTDGSGHTVDMSQGVRMTAVDTKVPGLTYVASVEGYRVYGVPGAPQRVFSPAQTDASDPGNRVVDDPGARPLDRSVVEAVDGRSSGTKPGTVKITHEAPGSVDFTVERATPGWAVVMQSFYPGWRATVNGHEVEVRRANDAFLAVRVPAGTSSVKVSYAPASVRLGLIVSLVGALLLALALAVVVRWRSGRAVGPSPESSPAQRAPQL